MWLLKLNESIKIKINENDIMLRFTRSMALVAKTLSVDVANVLKRGFPEWHINYTVYLEHALSQRFVIFFYVCSPNEWEMLCNFRTTKQRCDI